MRTLLAALIVGGALASAGAASAQITYYSQMSPPTPADQGDFKAGPQVQQFALPDPYVRKLAFLKQKLMFMKAKDGGRLTPDHAQALQRELDALNRQAAVRHN